MTWTAIGYCPRGVFRGAHRCNYRLVHRRDDGLHVCTVGDQRTGGRLEPVHTGQPFLTVALFPPADDAPQAETRWLAYFPAASWQEAEENHRALLTEMEANP